MSPLVGAFGPYLNRNGWRLLGISTRVCPTRGDNLHFYKFHIGDYKSATSHLSNEEDLAYRRLLDMYYDTEQPIPLDTEWVSRRLRVGSDCVFSVLRDFFVQQEDGWHHVRCESELENYRRLAEIARHNGARGGRKPSGFPAGSESVASGNPMETHLQANHKPLTTNHQPVRNTEPPVGVSDVVWQSFLTLRKAKKAPVTPAAVSRLEKEASKAGMSLEAALEVCCARGWTGFKAEWLADGTKGAQTMAALTRGMSKANFWEQADEPKQLL